MSTRANYFFENSGVSGVCLYCQMDNYPSGAAARFYLMLEALNLRGADRSCLAGFIRGNDAAKIYNDPCGAQYNYSLNCSTYELTIDKFDNDGAVLERQKVKLWDFINKYLATFSPDSGIAYPVAYRQWSNAMNYDFTTTDKLYNQAHDHFLEVLAEPERLDNCRRALKYCEGDLMLIIATYDRCAERGFKVFDNDTTKATATALLDVVSKLSMVIDTVTPDQFVKLVKSLTGGDTDTEQTEPADTGITVRENAERGGVEIVFSEKPDQAMRERIKAHGFKWSSRFGLWWAAGTDDNKAFAYDLAAQGA